MDKDNHQVSIQNNDDNDKVDCADKKSVAADFKVEDLKPNMVFLTFYTIVMGLGTLQSSWTIAGNASTAPILITQFGWDKEEAVHFNSLINITAMLGMAIGSLVAGNSIVYGRRKTLIFWETVAIFACALTLVRTLPTICVGRFVLGVSAGMLNVACGKSIDETMPLNLIGAFGAITNFGINFGITWIMLLGFMLPPMEDTTQQETDQLWRIIFGLPGVIAIFHIILLLTIFKEEPIIFNISNGNLKEAQTL